MAAVKEQNRLREIEEAQEAKEKEMDRLTLERASIALPISSVSLLKYHKEVCTTLHLC